MVKIEEHRQHLKSLQEQLFKQQDIGNWKKCRDLRKGIKRVMTEIKECERLMKIRSKEDERKNRT